ncbi:uncharacterized protein [Linepithema humile]|uniref:uncharacterized protein n=1 Tax=Linepithema humile TaxID=83485 RepID=UPI00062389B3|nr:PREDICTED: uncharacterized protein LOC105667946 [Linepithema humile]
MNFVNRESESTEIVFVYTCSLCETICRPNEIRNHPCLKGYTKFFIDKNFYFYPHRDDGLIITKRLVGEQEVFVKEADQDEADQEEADQDEADQEEADQEEVELIHIKNIKGDSLNSSDRPTNLLARKVHNEEFLIEEVRKRPPLWNFKLHISERGARTKQILWEEIAESMKGEMTAAEIKKKWKSLTDMFRRHRKAHKQSSGSAAAKKVKWLHFKRLSFLQNMELDNETTSNIVDLSNSQDVSLNSAETYDDDRSDSTSRNSERRSQNDLRREKLVEPGAIMDRMVDLMNDPVTVNVTGGLPNDEFTGFGMVVASKLRVLSADASEAAMLAILQLLRETRVNDQNK